MTGPTTTQSPVSIYRIEIDGHLDGSWADWFDGLQIDQQQHITVLSGAVIDQAALFGLLKKIHNMGLTIHLVQRIGITS